MKTKRLVMAALMAALVCVATMVIRIPSPKGYVNLGDSFVLLGGWMMSPLYGFFAAAIGSMLADLLLGFGAYAPVTFVIKGIMVLSVVLLWNVLNKKTGKTIARIVGGLTAELIMVLGYFLFEGFFYGSFLTAWLSVPFNAIQGAIGLLGGVVIVNMLDKSRLIKK